LPRHWILAEGGFNVDDIHEHTEPDLGRQAMGLAGGCVAAAGGLAALVGFFLGWVGAFGGSVSGLRLATEFHETFLFCMPILSILAIVVGLLAAATSFTRRRFPILQPLAGALLALNAVFLLWPIFAERDNVLIGWLCAPVGAFLIIVGAVIMLAVPAILSRDVSS
jgi:hypothetical protein